MAALMCCYSKRLGLSIQFESVAMHKADSRTSSAFIDVVIAPLKYLYHPKYPSGMCHADTSNTALYYTHLLKAPFWVQLRHL